MGHLIEWKKNGLFLFLHLGVFRYRSLVGVYVQTQILHHVLPCLSLLASICLLLVCLSLSLSATVTVSCSPPVLNSKAEATLSQPIFP